MCEYCQSGAACDHGAKPGSACACSLAGTGRCSECGCECASWDWGLGVAGPASVRSFLGVGDDENPGFSEYPAPKARLVAAATQELQEGEADPADAQWLAKNLPEGTYADRGSVLAALSSTIAWTGEDPAALVAPLPMRAIASGARLLVGPNQTAVLVGKDGRPLDAYGPGQHVLTRETAPRAAAVSRPPAPHFPHTVISATPVFASTREVRTAIDQTGRTRSGDPVSVRGSVVFSVASVAEFVGANRSLGRGFSSKETEAALATALGPAIGQALAAHDVRELGPSSPVLEEAIRAGAGAIGIRVSSVSLEPVRPVSPNDQLAALRQHQAEALSHLPPEMQARMAAAMQRAQAAGRAPGPPPPPGAGPATPPAAPPVAAGLVCPSCHASNPPSIRFCGNCGQPLVTKRTCPRCGTEAAPGVKFCGNCGGPVG